jgi:hypothetical protein
MIPRQPLPAMVILSADVDNGLMAVAAALCMIVPWQSTSSVAFEQTPEWNFTHGL